MYPNEKGIRFDMAYYLATHMPLVKRLAGAALLKMAVEEGISGMAPGSLAPYVALGHLTFESVEAFQGAFMPHAAEILADIPNYTDSQPMVQISTIKM
jgi:uncharacterized protein (TIGR02118 family)